MSDRATCILLTCSLAVTTLAAGCPMRPTALEPRKKASALPAEPIAAAGRTTVCDERIRVSLTAAPGSDTVRQLGYVSEVVEVSDRTTVKVRQLFGEFRQNGAPAESDVRGVQVHLRRSDAALPTRVVVGDAPAAMTNTAQDLAFENCLPKRQVQVGDRWTLSAETGAAWGRRLDPDATLRSTSGGRTDRIDCTLTELRLCHRPASGHDRAAASAPVHCAIVAFRWRHSGDVPGARNVTVEITGTLWIELDSGLIVHRTGRGVLREQPAGGQSPGKVIGTIDMAQTAWPISQQQFARYQQRHGAPAGPVELPSGLIFRAAVPARRCIPLG